MFESMAIRIVIVLAIIALVFIFIRWANIPIPGYVWQILGVLAVALLVIWAIRFLMVAG